MTIPHPQDPESLTVPWREHLGGFVFALAGTMVLFSSTWGETLFFRDITYWSFPGFHFLNQSLGAGQLPLWSPDLFLGYPFLAEPANAVLYPLTWMVQLFSIPVALKVYAGLHYVLAGYLMWRLLRAWALEQIAALFGALVWMGSGYLVSIHLNLNYLIPAAWYPGVLFCCGRFLSSRRWEWLLALSLAWAAVLLGGDPQAFLFAGVLIFFYTLLVIRRETLKLLLLLGLAGLLTLLLVEAQFMPSLELAVACTRVQGIDFREATTWSHHPWRLLEWIWPELWGPIFPAEKFWGPYIEGSRGMPWVGIVYLGLFPLLLALGRCRDWRQPRIGFLALILLLFFLLGLGDWSPLYRLVWDALPFYRIFRYPEKHLAVASFALAGLSAFGFQSLLAPESPSAPRAFFHRWKIITALLAIILVALFLTAAPLAQALARYELRVNQVVREPSLIRACFLNAALRTLMVALLYLLIWRLLERGRSAWLRAGPALLAVTAVDLLTLGRGQFHGTDPSLFTATPSASRIIHQDRADLGEKFRFYRSPTVTRPSELFHPAGASYSEQAIYWNRDTLNRNQGVPEGLEELFGYESAKLTRIHRFRQKALDLGTLRMLNVAYLLDGFHSGQVPASLNLPLVAEDARLNLRVFRNKGYFPRAYFVDGIRAAPDESQFLDFLPATNLRRNVVLLHPESSRAGAVFLPASIQTYQPQQVEVMIQNPVSGHLVLSDTYFPGWTATVDGKPARILRANYLIRAVALEPGEHQIIFTYRPWPWRIGRDISLTSLLLLVVLIFFQQRKAPSPAGRA